MKPPTPSANGIDAECVSSTELACDETTERNEEEEEDDDEEREERRLHDRQWSLDHHSCCATTTNVRMDRRTNRRDRNPAR